MHVCSEVNLIKLNEIYPQVNLYRIVSSEVKSFPVSPHAPIWTNPNAIFAEHFSLCVSHGWKSRRMGCGIPCGGFPIYIMVICTCMSRQPSCFSRFLILLDEFHTCRLVCLWTILSLPICFCERQNCSFKCTCNKADQWPCSKMNSQSHLNLPEFFMPPETRCVLSDVHC